MSNYKGVTKGVNFNILDPDQNRLLTHAQKRKNFSSYVKRLIQRDIDNRFTVAVPQNNINQPPPDIDEGLMNGLI